MRKRDGIRLLPKRITETLVRAFAALPAFNTDVLILQPVTEPRAPLWKIKDDYNVLWMGEKVGRIYLNLERFEAREFNTPWCWSFSHPTHGRSAYGYVSESSDGCVAGRLGSDRDIPGVLTQMAARREI